MPTNFPSSLDTFTNPSSGDTLSNPSHAGQHSDVNDAVEAMQAVIGTGLTSSNTIKNQLDNIGDTSDTQVKSVWFYS